MGSKSSSLLCLALLLAFSSAIYAFDITQLLGQYPEFSTFNKYLTETKLAEDINNRNTITILAVENGAISGISGKSQEEIKAIISTHVILDYFDEKKLMEAQGSGQQLTTLFQASGNAVNQQGFLKVSLIGEGEISFSSAVDGANANAVLVRTVTTEPYNISVLQVTRPIVFSGVVSKAPSSPSQGATAKAPAPSSSQGAKAPLPSSQAAAKSPSPSSQGAKPSPQSAKAPAPAAQSAKAPVPSSQGAKAPAQSAKAPTPAQTATAPSPSDDAAAAAPAGDAAAAPGASSPIAADGPLADGPSADDGAAADAPPSSASTSKVGLVGSLLAFASMLLVL